MTVEDRAEHLEGLSTGTTKRESVIKHKATSSEGFQSSVSGYLVRPIPHLFVVDTYSDTVNTMSMLQARLDQNPDSFTIDLVLKIHVHNSSQPLNSIEGSKKLL